MSRSTRPSSLRQLTLRGIDPELEARIREMARRDNLSLNQAAIALLRQGAGLSSRSRADLVGDSLDQFCGIWSKEEADQFDEFMKDFEQIDASLWQ
jgi:hypothetical protein